MNDLDEQEGPTEVAPEEGSEQDIDSLSDEALDLIISGTPDERNVQEPTQPESSEEEKEVEPPQEATPPEAPVDYEKLKAQVEEQAKFINRRSHEIGQLRTQLRQAIAEKEQIVKQLEIDSPVEAVRAERQVERLKEHDESLEAEDQELAARAKFLQVVPAHVTPEQFDPEEMRATLIGDGVDAKSADNFIATLDRQDPALVINMAHRSYQAKALRQLVPYTKKLLAENEKLRQEMGNTGENIARSISRELKKPKSLQASRPVSRTQSTSVNLDNLSDQELEEIIKKGSVNGINNI